MRGMRFSFPVLCTTTPFVPGSMDTYPPRHQSADTGRRPSDLPADQHGVVHLYATVHDHGKAVFFGVPRGLRVDHSRLHPQHLRPGGDGVLCDRRDLLAPAEDVHDIYGLWYLLNRSVRFLTQNRPGEVRVYGKDPVPG